ncbi:MAG: SRPBCC domain-containing protein [Alphaproteobacteria bacterium]|nr:SRPBCC domain-containing protein [Alphaproteobacteria bacterium]
MNFIEITRNINAAPDEVWRVLTDAKLLQTSDLGINRLDGQIALGQTLRLWSEASPNRVFALKVVEFEQGRCMVWKGGMPLRLFTGTRRFEITASSTGSQLHIREDFTGPLSPLIWRSMPDLNPSFEKFANGVKRLAEGASTCT